MARLRVLGWDFMISSHPQGCGTRTPSCFEGHARDSLNPASIHVRVWPAFLRKRGLLLVYGVYRISYNFKFEAKSIPRNQEKWIEPSNGKIDTSWNITFWTFVKIPCETFFSSPFFETTLVLVVGSPIRKFASPAMLHSSTVQQLQDSQPLAITEYWVHLKLQVGLTMYNCTYSTSMPNSHIYSI